jgi:serine protease Do
MEGLAIVSPRFGKELASLTRYFSTLKFSMKSINSVSPKFVLAACVISCGLAMAQPAAGQDSATQDLPSQEAAGSRSPVASARELSGAFEDVAERITPSLVSIKASKSMKFNGGNGQLPPGALPFQLPPDVLEELQKRMPQNSIPNEGLGTGFVVDRSGHILTNNHVVDGADTIIVRFHDKSEVKAKVVGQDSRTDLAVLKVEKANVVPAELGDSDRLRIGEWVIAAGSPFGLENSITAGIVSAKGRSLARGAQLEDFIQTDAAINPGNSGGPLLTLDGKVVGINTAIFSRSGGYMGIGFAIPVSMAKQVVDSLIKDGKVTRGWLGVSIQDLTPDLASSFDYDQAQGALIADIDPNGPAAKSQLTNGDIVVEFDGKPIKTVNDLQNTVASTPPNSERLVKVFRGGSYETLEITIGELEAGAVTGHLGGSDEDTAGKLGMSLQPLSGEKRQELGIKSKGGVLVAQVTPFSAAAKANLDSGDVIVRVGGTEVDSPSALSKALKAADVSKGIRLVVESQGMSRFAILKMEEEE